MVFEGKALAEWPSAHGALVVLGVSFAMLDYGRNRGVHRHPGADRVHRSDKPSRMIMRMIGVQRER